MGARAVDYIHDRLDRTGATERRCGAARSDFSRDGWFGNSGRRGGASALANHGDRARPSGSADFPAIVRTLCPAASGCNSAGCQPWSPGVAQRPHDHHTGNACPGCANRESANRDEPAAGPAAGNPTSAGGASPRTRNCSRVASGRRSRHRARGNPDATLDRASARATRRTSAGSGSQRSGAHDRPSG